MSNRGYQAPPTLGGGPEPEKRATNCSQLYKFVSLSPKGTSRSRVKTRVMPLPEWHRPATSDSSVSETNRAVRMFAFCGANGVQAVRDILLKDVLVYSVTMAEVVMSKWWVVMPVCCC